jgi:hypothetical protein
MDGVFRSPKPRDKLKVIAWSLAWMILRGKTEEQARTSIKRRFKWLTDEVIDVAMGRARTWIKNADHVNAVMKAAESKGK